MKRTQFLFSSLLVLLAPRFACAAAPVMAEPLDPARIAAIEKMLPDNPEGMGPKITDRATWEKLSKLPAYQSLLKSAKKINADPVTDLPDDLFLAFTKTGDRSQFDKISGRRRANFQTLVLAECATNEGTFLPKISDYLHALCAERTWVLSAHDPKLDNWNGKAHDIDLGDSMLAWQMATTYWLLGDKLSAGDQKLILDNLNTRLITPFQLRLDSKAPLFWWMTGTNNWNAVCFAGTIGTALAITPDKHTRAEFIAAAEHYTSYFLAGFNPDGYCTEGLSYWNYGFGHYVMLAETVRQATAGKLDLLAEPAAAQPALYGSRIQIMNDISPAFADCPVNAKPAPELMWYLNHYFSLNLAGYDTLDSTSPPGDLTAEVVYRFTDPTSSAIEAQAAAPDPLRHFFQNTGVLIARPAQNATCKMGVALKGGNNNESHNHNDIGSYVLLLNDKELILDPGPERYSARTFSAHRYDSKLLSSYGHAVPLVADQLQQVGAKAQAKILKADFTDSTDILSLDITTAYPVPTLKSLTRTWVYSRQNAGSLTTTDDAQFSSPENFATTLITRGTWTQLDDTHYQIKDGTQSVAITIDASSPFKITTEEIHEDSSVIPLRILITLTEKSLTPKITITATPN